MDNNIARRIFLTGVIGGLAAGPFVIRYAFQKRSPATPHRFSQELKKYESLLQVPIRSLDAPQEIDLPFAPPVGRSWNYVIFLPSYLPQGMTRAIDGEPDMFVVREGKLTVNRTNKGQVLLTGSDTNSLVCSPLTTDERQRSDIMLLVHEGELRSAKPKDEASESTVDRQFGHLLALEDRPVGPLKVGMKWKSANSGRIKPYQGFATDYEVIGLAEVGGRKTVQVRFRAEIPNLLGQPGVSAEPPVPGASMTNHHHGDAYFDLESGLLVRQDVEMESHSKGVTGLPSKDQDLVVKAKFIVQLFEV